MKPRNVMVGVAMVATALAASLGASGEVFARGRWENVIAPRSSGRARLAPAVSEVGGQREPREVETPRPRPPASARATAAASSSAPAYSSSYREERDSSTIATPRVSSRVLEHAAGDRLREALAAAQDDPKSTARISRLIAAAAAEARRNKALADRVWYWRDPFSPNPRRAIVLSMEAQLEMQVAAARLEVARARVEANAARLEAAQAHVEAAHARLEAARAQGPGARNGAVAARHDSRLARPTGDDDAPARTARRAPALAPAGGATPADSNRGGDSARVRRRVAAPRSVSASTSETALARNEGAAAAASSRHRDIGAARAAASAPEAPAPTPSPSPATWRSRDPRGIVVVPINTPVAALPKPAARR